MRAVLPMSWASLTSRQLNMLYPLSGMEVARAVPIEQTQRSTEKAPAQPCRRVDLQGKYYMLKGVGSCKWEWGSPAIRSVASLPVLQRTVDATQAVSWMPRATLRSLIQDESLAVLELAFDRAVVQEPLPPAMQSRNSSRRASPHGR